MAQDIADVQTSASPALEIDVVTPRSARVLFWRPRFLRNAPALHHLPFLFWVTDVLRPRVAVSLGDRDSLAYFALCQAAERLDLETRFHGFGPWGEAGVPEALVQHNEEYYPYVSRLSASSSGPGLRGLPAGPVDLLSVWPDPAEDPAMQEAMLRTQIGDNWSTRMSERGVIVIHGVNRLLEAETGDGFLAGLTGSLPHFHLESGEGLLLVLCGNHPEERLIRLCRMTAGDRGYGSVLQVFGHLGHALRAEMAARSAGTGPAPEPVRQAPRVVVAPAAAPAKPDTRDADIARLTAALAEQQAGQEQTRAELAAHIRTLTATLETRQQETDRQQVRNTQLAQQLAAAATERDQMLRQVTLAAEASQIAADEKREALLRELALHRGTQEQNQLKIAGLEAASATRERDLHQRLTRQEEEIATLRVALQAAETGTDTERGRLRAAERQRDEAREHARALQATIDQLLTSTSWKLTAPMRRLLETTRRG